MAHEQTTTETALGGPTGVIIGAISAIASSTEESLTFGRGIVSAKTGFTLRPIRPGLSEAEQAKMIVEFRPAIAKVSPVVRVEILTDELKEALDFLTPQALSLEGLLGTLAELLLKPPRVPGDPCLAPAPLLRDLLDMALGKITGGLGAAVSNLGLRVGEMLFPAFAQAEDLAHFIQAVLDDPITAALNLILGQRTQIDCVVEGSLGAAESVLATGIRHLEEAIAEALS